METESQVRIHTTESSRDFFRKSRLNTNKHTTNSTKDSFSGEINIPQTDLKFDYLFQVDFDISEKQST